MARRHVLSVGGAASSSWAKRPIRKKIIRQQPIPEQAWLVLQLLPFGVGAVIERSDELEPKWPSLIPGGRQERLPMVIDG